MIDRRYSLALVAFIGIAIGLMVPVEQRSSPVQATSAQPLPQLDASLAELQTLVAKLQPPPSKQTDFEQVLDNCRCDDCDCSSLSPRGVSKPTGASPGFYQPDAQARDRIYQPDAQARDRTNHLAGKKSSEVVSTGSMILDQGGSGPCGCRVKRVNTGAAF